MIMEQSQFEVQKLLDMHQWVCVWEWNTWDDVSDEIETCLKTCFCLCVGVCVCARVCVRVCESEWDENQYCICPNHIFHMLCMYSTCIALKTSFFPCVLTDPVQPAKRGGAGKPEEKADHAAAARHRILFCADKQGQHCWRSAAAGGHPHRPWPDQDQAQHTSGSGRQDDHRTAKRPDEHTCQVSADAPVTKC